MPKEKQDAEYSYEEMVSFATELRGFLDTITASTNLYYPRFNGKMDYRLKKADDPTSTLNLNRRMRVMRKIAKELSDLRREMRVVTQSREQKVQEAERFRHAHRAKTILKKGNHPIRIMPANWFEETMDSGAQITDSGVVLVSDRLSLSTRLFGSNSVKLGGLLVPIVHLSRIQLEHPFRSAAAVVWDGTKYLNGYVAVHRLSQAGRKAVPAHFADFRSNAVRQAKTATLREVERLLEQ